MSGHEQGFLDGLFFVLSLISVFVTYLWCLWCVVTGFLSHFLLNIMKRNSPFREKKDKNKLSSDDTTRDCVLFGVVNPMIRWWDFCDQSMIWWICCDLNMTKASLYDLVQLVWYTTDNLMTLYEVWDQVVRVFGVHHMIWWCLFSSL